jgi:hypothetical protein
MLTTPSASRHIYLYSKCGKQVERQVKFSWVQSCRQQEQLSCGMLLFTTDYPDCQHVLFSLASPWLGPCLSAKRPFDSCAHAKVYLHCLSLPTCNASLADPCSPPSCQGFAFSAQRTLTRPCSGQSFFSLFSYWSPTPSTRIMGVSYHFWLFSLVLNVLPPIRYLCLDF